MTLDPPETAPPARGPGRPAQGDGAPSEVRDRLLDAATELAVEQGFETCGLREIAGRAGVSPGMIAYYFGDRQGLYEAMLARAFARIEAKVREVMADPDRSGDDRIEALLRIHVASIAADPWLPRLLMREVLARAESPLHDAVRDAIARGPLELMIEWLTDAQARGEIRADYDPKLLAMSIASLTGFPFLVMPLLGDALGIEFDAAFPDRLIEHNRKLLGQALRAPSETDS